MLTPTFAPWPTRIQSIIFLDFDETVRPSTATRRLGTKIRELEALLVHLAMRKGAIFGWVSGSNTSALFRKASDYIGVFPHFIGSALGSELSLSDGRAYEASVQWARHIHDSGYRAHMIDDFVRAATRRGFDLRLQDAAFQGANKRSYYLDAAQLRALDSSPRELIACNEESALSVLVTKCNPAAGDPEDTFDVDVVPRCCGKGQQCAFVSDLFAVKPRDTVAFGDSDNDSDMLRFAGAPYVVGNGDLENINASFEVTQGEYCDGILRTLEQIYL